MKRRAWRRPTLPPLERQYHWRGGFSLPSSGWDRVYCPSLWPPGFPEGRDQRSEVRTAAVLPGSELCRCPEEASCVGVFGGRVCRPSDLCHLISGMILAAGCGWGSAIERLVPVGCAGCPASTSGLSTWWSTTALKRDLVLKGVSRLDAFSGYPVRT